MFNGSQIWVFVLICRVMVLIIKCLNLISALRADQVAHLVSGCDSYDRCQYWRNSQLAATGTAQTDFDDWLFRFGTIPKNLILIFD